MIFYCFSKFKFRAPFGVHYSELKDEIDKIFGMFLSNMTGIKETEKMKY